MEAEDENEADCDEESEDIFRDLENHDDDEPAANDFDVAMARGGQEAQTYLLETRTYVEYMKARKEPVDGIQWWKKNKARFPIVASLAREWLAVPASSTPSERVFSIRGIVDSPKRSRMKSSTMQSQVCMHLNPSTYRTPGSVPGTPGTVWW